MRTRRVTCHSLRNPPKLMVASFVEFSHRCSAFGHDICRHGPATLQGRPRLACDRHPHPPWVHLGFPQALLASDACVLLLPHRPGGQSWYGAAGWRGLTRAARPGMHKALAVTWQIARRSRLCDAHLQIRLSEYVESLLFGVGRSGLCATLVLAHGHDRRPIPESFVSPQL